MSVDEYGRAVGVGKLSAKVGALVLAAGLVLASSSLPLAAQGRVTFVSAEAALEQGLNAYRAGYHQIALPALSFAAEHNLFLGRFFLARLLSDNQASATDHARAFRIYRQIVSEHANTIDVDDDERAPFVGKALTAVARYVHRGLPEMDLAPNAVRAAEFLQEAATFFRDPDGQYELAKLYLTGDGVEQDRRKALHWLSILSQEGHVSAQAFFADLLWTGKIVPRDEKRALALITVAVEHAPATERIWIEDIYQRIFCGAQPSVRQQADGLVASYRQSFANRVPADPIERAAEDPSPSRQCGSGETIQVPFRAPNSEPAQRRSSVPSQQPGLRDVRDR